MAQSKSHNSENHEELIEMEIHRLLKEGKDPEYILSTFSDHFSNPETSLQDRKTIFSFALTTGLTSQISQWLPDLFTKRVSIPWGHITNYILTNQLSTSNELVESIFKGAKKQHLLNELVINPKWDVFEPRLPEYRMKTNQERKKNAREQKSHSIKKLMFFVHNQLVEEEKKLLASLLKSYPQDPEILTLKSDFDYRWARQVISHHSHHEQPWEITKTELPPQEITFFKTITQSMLKLSADSPELAHDFAVALLMMGYEEGCLKVLANQTLSPRSYWLKAEALLSYQHYVECLDHLSLLEQSLGGDPETIFGVTYLRAQALWGLKQMSAAIELLQTLTAVRPNYRSAMSLLKEWQRGKPT